MPLRPLGFVRTRETGAGDGRSTEHTYLGGKPTQGRPAPWGQGTRCDAGSKPEWVERPGRVSMCRAHLGRRPRDCSGFFPALGASAVGTGPVAELASKPFDVGRRHDPFRPRGSLRRFVLEPDRLCRRRPGNRRPGSGDRDDQRRSELVERHRPLGRPAAGCRVLLGRRGLRRHRRHDERRGHLCGDCRLLRRTEDGAVGRHRGRRGVLPFRELLCRARLQHHDGAVRRHPDEHERWLDLVPHGLAGDRERPAGLFGRRAMSERLGVLRLGATGFVLVSGDPLDDERLVQLLRCPARGQRRRAQLRRLSDRHLLPRLREHDDANGIRGRPGR